VIRSCSNTHPRSKRFVTTEYFFDEVGRPGAEMPDHCPLGADGSMCHIKEHCRRDRKTGPCHALVVAKCVPHMVFFTLYPPGYEPYGRKKVAPEQGREDWRETIFEAAIDAASGEPAWPREFDGGEGWWTQRRQIERASRRLGLVCPVRQAERVADALGVGVLVHTQARKDYASAGGFRSRARAVVAVLDCMSLEAMVLERMFASGHLAGTSPEPWIWTSRGYLTPFH
jgi:hypothetical protein